MHVPSLSRKRRLANRGGDHLARRRPRCADETPESAPATQQGAPPAAASAADFNTHIAPLFKKYCLGCHGADDAEHGLVLETHESLLKGGQGGAAILPGKSDSSRLVLMLDGRAKPVMPPEGNEGPTKDEIALLKSWIDAAQKARPAPLPIPRCWSRPRSKSTARRDGRSMPSRSRPTASWRHWPVMPKFA